MKTKEITYFGERRVVMCDENCRKAWGWASRPQRRIDKDWIMYLSDHDTGEAPRDPGTYEGGYGKPLSSAEFPNKWCVRQCERCTMSDKCGNIEPLDWNVGQPSREEA